jgi:hypothetical protein
VLLLLLANLFFYWNCQQQIGKQLVYNRSMQHFQVQFTAYRVGDLRDLQRKNSKHSSQSRRKNVNKIATKLGYTKNK